MVERYGQRIFTIIGELVAGCRLCDYGLRQAEMALEGAFRMFIYWVSYGVRFFVEIWVWISFEQFFQVGKVSWIASASGSLILITLTLVSDFSDV